MTVRHLLASLLLAALTMTAAEAVEPATTYDVILLQPDATMKARVPDLDRFADYIRALQREARVPGPAAAASGFVVIALRPDGSSRAWLDFDEPLNAGVSTMLVQRLRALPVPAVQGGPVVFALKVGLWGGKPSARVAPSPRQWRDAAARAGHALEPGELVEKIWNEEEQQP